jgi:hypothetical protein
VDAASKLNTKQKQKQKDKRRGAEGVGDKYTKQKHGRYGAEQKHGHMVKLGRHK